MATNEHQFDARIRGRTFSPRRRRSSGFATHLTRHCRDLVVAQAFLAIGQRSKAMIQRVELLRVERNPRSSQRLASACRPLCLPRTSLRLRHADRLRIDDLVRGPLFQKSILMNAGFVGERVLADDRLVGLRPERDDRRQQLAGRVKMFGDDARFKRQPVAARIHRHDDFFQSGIAGALANAVDGALDLSCSRLDRRQRIRRRQAQIVMAMYADNGRIAESLHHSSDHGRVFVRRSE